VAGLTEALEAHDRIGIDTAVFIYEIDGSAPYGDLADEALRALARGAFEGLTSTVTLMELAVGPLRVGRADLADRYELLLSNFPHLAILDLDRRSARRAAELRATYRLRPADALQVGTCLAQGGSAFLTNDRDLRRVAEVQVLVLDDFVSA